MESSAELYVTLTLCAKQLLLLDGWHIYVASIAKGRQGAELDCYMQTQQAICSQHLVGTAVVYVQCNINEASAVNIVLWRSLRSIKYR